MTPNFSLLLCLYVSSNALISSHPDDSKFGQKMLEKMGWKKGEGLGRNGQGLKENIKIRWKLDSKGSLSFLLYKTLKVYLKL